MICSEIEQGRQSFDIVAVYDMQGKCCRALKLLAETFLGKANVKWNTGNKCIIYEVYSIREESCQS